MNQSLQSHFQLVDDPAGNCCYLALVSETARGFRMTALIRSFMDGRTRDGMRYERVIRMENLNTWNQIRALLQ